MKYFTILFSLSVFFRVLGQGINCDIEYKPKFKALKSTNVIANRGIFNATNQQSFNEVSYWNLPASYNDCFNYFAASKELKGSFDIISSGDYRFLNPEDKKFSEFSEIKEKFWIVENKPFGNNKVKINNGLEVQLNDRLPIYVAQTKSHFYKNTGLTYDQIISKNLSAYKPISEYITEKIVENNYFNTYNVTNFNFSGLIKFTDKAEFESNNINAVNENLNAKLKENILEWAKTYQPFSKDENWPIYANKSLSISLKKESTSKTINFKNINKKELTNFKDFEKIFESEIKMPTKSECTIENSKFTIQIDNVTTKIEEKNSINFIETPKNIKLYPTLAFTGLSHYLIVKKNYRKKIIPALTIGSAGVFALSWGIKEVFYARYLEQPNIRTNAYKTANIGYKVMKAAFCTYLIGVSLDLNLTYRTIKKLNILVSEINPKL